MSFCWFTSFIGYPNFFKNQGRGYELAESFLKLAQASLSGKSYTEAKSLFPYLDHAQVETKKAAFQEFGLLYVVPRSDTIALTPLGRQIYDWCSDSGAREDNRREILLALSRALTKYQFNNPLPVGGTHYRERAESSDVLPYLACYYLMLKLDGLITINELRGAIFGLQYMAELRNLEQIIRDHRQTKTPFSDLPALPLNRGTANNLKIYFMSHFSLDGEIIKDTTANLYDRAEQAYVMTQLGYEIIESVMNEQWPDWRDNSSAIPQAKDYKNSVSYFANGVGQSCSSELLKIDADKVFENDIQIAGSVLDEDEVENLKELERREFQEGRRKLIQHERLEKTRSAALINEAKRLFRLNNGRLFCEACDFDFEEKYGLRGKDYIEAHHKIPISTLEGPVNNTVNELAMVCSNCHRMLHRPPWISIDELKGLIQKKSFDILTLDSKAPETM